VLAARNIGRKVRTAFHLGGRGIGNGTLKYSSFAKSRVSLCKESSPKSFSGVSSENSATVVRDKLADILTLISWINSVGMGFRRRTIHFITGKPSTRGVAMLRGNRDAEGAISMSGLCPGRRRWCAWFPRNPWRQRERTLHRRDRTGRSNHRLERAPRHDGVVCESETRPVPEGAMHQKRTNRISRYARATGSSFQLVV
jgi:hypothetical protein